MVGGRFLKPDKKHLITDVRALILPLVYCFDKVIYFLGPSGPYLQNVTLAQITLRVLPSVKCQETSACSPHLTCCLSTSFKMYLGYRTPKSQKNVFENQVARILKTYGEKKKNLYSCLHSSLGSYSSRGITTTKIITMFGIYLSPYKAQA